MSNEYHPTPEELDAEIDAMNKTYVTMVDLNAMSRERVIVWLCEALGMQPPWSFGSNKPRADH